MLPELLRTSMLSILANIVTNSHLPTPGRAGRIALLGRISTGFNIKTMKSVDRILRGPMGIFSSTYHNPCFSLCSYGEKGRMGQYAGTARWFALTYGNF